MVSSPSSNYAGEISPAQAWEKLKADPKAQLLDVRTLAEWNFVGLPDLSQLGRQTLCVEWQGFPGGTQNPAFAAEAAQALAAAGAGKSDPICLMCRSGARSRAAAIALTAAGFEQAFNVAEGFEGDVDREGHRGRANGWKAAGLPWRQG
jgi:rhodanese-related sulfurtransferase